ncbi:Myb-like DNA-binding domain containing protein [Histomonas meleagridis]|uniref:Myb-like DNA-binding domain containing protein n=1 Tax=Histomonas meleagridis TaxID=135588 RepID=UPI003559EBCA|nr:Myb-like DNA-binding domain containing protein [Histomonas meleagridis]KAH0802351.1 Myb-like DNA-binding domain containing protein [Histomonas meleagridis]
MNFQDTPITDAEIDTFIATLPHQTFTHMDVMRCYSIYMKNEFSAKKDTPQIHHPEPVTRMISDGKRIPMRWSTIEIDALRSGVEKHGKGNWAKILGDYHTIFGPTGRTSRDLKKKWLGLENKNKRTKGISDGFSNQFSLNNTMISPQPQTQIEQQTDPNTSNPNQ